MELKAWLKGVYKQMEEDMIAKGQYKKCLSSFAYRKEEGVWQYFYDAKAEVTYEARAQKELEGYVVTPVFYREKWLKDMGMFRTMREAYRREYEAYCRGGYLERFMEIKALEGVVKREVFERLEAKVKENCSEEAQKSFAVYARRMNMSRA